MEGDGDDNEDGGEETKGETKEGTETGGGNEETKEGKTDDAKPVETIDDRVFVCQGKDTVTQDIETWVMTINRTYDTVIFWEVKNHTHYVLKGRIKKG